MTTLSAMTDGPLCAVGSGALLSTLGGLEQRMVPVVIGGTIT